MKARPEPVEGPAERPLMVSTMEERVPGETRRPNFRNRAWQLGRNCKKLPMPVERLSVEKLYDDRLRAAIQQRW